MRLGGKERRKDLIHLLHWQPHAHVTDRELELTVLLFRRDALHLHPPMSPYLAQSAQRELPGIVKPPKTGIAQPPITDAPPTNRTPGPPSLDTVSTDTGHGVHSTLDTVSTDSKAFDPSTPDSKPVIHHGDAALTISPSTTPLERQLRSEAECGHRLDTGLRPRVSNHREKVMCKSNVAGQRVAEHLGEAHPGDATLERAAGLPRAQAVWRSKLSAEGNGLWVRPHVPAESHARRRGAETLSGGLAAE